MRRAEQTYAPGSLERNSNAAAQSKGRGKKKPAKGGMGETRTNNFQATRRDYKIHNSLSISRDVSNENHRATI